jgi:hypothetical protein|tara:strand:+ start:11119 stop:11349 length:231 start_codon:yes stop_codon:yes gene_type:complete
MDFDTFGLDRNAAINSDVCVICQQEADTFTDRLSCREYARSGMCEDCQNNLHALDRGEPVFVWTRLYCSNGIVRNA